MTTEYKTPEERVGSLVDEVRDGKVPDYLTKATELCEYIRELEEVYNKCRDAYYAPSMSIHPQTALDASHICANLKAALDSYVTRRRAMDEQPTKRNKP